MAEFDLEQELQLELAKLDQIFFSTSESVDEDGQNGLFSSQNHSVSYDCCSPQQSKVAYELAVAEIEKEELQDQLRILLSRTEDFDAQILQLHAENQNLFAQYSQVVRENERLKQESSDVRNVLSPETPLIHVSSTLLQAVTSAPRDTPPIGMISEKEYQALEFMLAETRAKLARYQQHFEDLSLAKENTVKELNKERSMRKRIEKERDAYSAAYEMSLKKIDHWAQTKALAKRVLGGGDSSSQNNSSHYRQTRAAAVINLSGNSADNALLSETASHNRDPLVS
jgi:chromosome segregation ATPase